MVDWGQEGSALGLKKSNKKNPIKRNKVKAFVTCGSSKRNSWAASAATSANQSCAATCSGAQGQSSRTDGIIISGKVSENVRNYSHFYIDSLAADRKQSLIDN